MTNDPINPSHYRQGKIECIDAIEAATVGKTGIEAACVANITKYLWRYEAKNGLQDVLKAKWYLASSWTFYRVRRLLVKPQMGLR